MKTTQFRSLDGSIRCCTLVVFLTSVREERGRSFGSINQWMKRPANQHRNSTMTQTIRIQIHGSIFTFFVTRTSTHTYFVVSPKREAVGGQRVC